MFSLLLTWDALFREKICQEVLFHELLNVILFINLINKFYLFYLRHRPSETYKLLSLSQIVLHTFPPKTHNLFSFPSVITHPLTSGEGRLPETRSL